MKLIHGNTRLNREEKVPMEMIPQTTTLLPSISNVKVSMRDRSKSQSAKKLPAKG